MTDQPRNPTVEIRDLRKAYGARLAVAGMSFSVGKGEIFGFLGPNGAGKSTALSMMSTLLTPDSGHVRICGLDLEQEVWAIKRLIGVVPQDLALYARLTALENLVFFGRIYGLSGSTLEQRCRRALEVVNLTDRAGDIVDTFSGGMKRRLNIAAALVHEPRVITMDEPTVGLDPQSRQFIYEFVRSLRGEITVIYTTHYMDEAEQLCDRVAILDEGRILALDTPRELIQRYGGGLIRAGFGPESPPQLIAAIDALPHVTQVKSHNGGVQLKTDATENALLDLVQLCKKEDIDILSLEVLEPNLETVFLQLTGKRLRE